MSKMQRVCGRKAAWAGLNGEEKKSSDYMAQVREVVKKELVLCIQPDPVTSYERYGVDFDDLAKYADAFNVVMFSKNYATPWYWETLARGFKKLLKKPFYISFYVFGPGDNPKDVPSTSELLTVSVRCARAGADGFLYLTEGASQIQAFQKAALEQVELREKLRNYGRKPVQEFLDFVASWQETSLTIFNKKIGYYAFLATLYPLRFYRISNRVILSSGECLCGFHFRLG